MKNILFISILLLTSFLFAQPVLTTTSLAGDPTNDNNFSTKGNYARDFLNERDQYVGLWRYNQNGVLFELKIEKFDKLKSFAMIEGVEYYFYDDCVVFKYKLVKNGVTIYDNLNTTVTHNHHSTSMKYGVNNFLSGLMLDATRNVRANVTITLLNTNPQKIFFDLSSGAYHLMDPNGYGQNPGVPLFNIPIDGIEMERIN